jgi:DNA repair exonuclease SbcCD ATPase subunit
MSQALIIGGVAVAGLIAFTMGRKGEVEAEGISGEAQFLLAQQQAAAAEFERMQMRQAELDRKEAEDDARREREMRERDERDHQRRMDEIQRENERQDRRDREWEERQTWEREQKRQRATEIALAAAAETERIQARQDYRDAQEALADAIREAQATATSQPSVSNGYSSMVDDWEGETVPVGSSTRMIQPSVSSTTIASGIHQVNDPYAAQRAAQAIKVKQLQAQVNAQKERSKWETRMSGSSNTTPAYSSGRGGPGRSFSPVAGTSSTVELHHDWDWYD